MVHPKSPLPPEAPSPDPDHLIKIANMKMPFGKYQGLALMDLPEPYLVWFSNQGFPKGELGHLLQSIFEIKVNGLEYLLEPLRKP